MSGLKSELSDVLLQRNSSKKAKRIYAGSMVGGHFLFLLADVILRAAPDLLREIGISHC